MGPIIVKSIGEIQRDCKEQADQLMKERLVIKTKERCPNQTSLHYLRLEIQSRLKTLEKTKKS